MIGNYTDEENGVYYYSEKKLRLCSILKFNIIIMRVAFQIRVWNTFNKWEEGENKQGKNCYTNIPLVQNIRNMEYVV